MNVFVNEPLLDWEKYARRLAREQSSGEGLAAMFPKKKIDIARRKLEGDNPAHITLAELTESTIQQRVRAVRMLRASPPLTRAQGGCYNAIKGIVAGDKEHNVRARVGRRCSSVKEQGTCTARRSLGFARSRPCRSGVSRGPGHRPQHSGPHVGRLGGVDLRCLRSAHCK